MTTLSLYIYVYILHNPNHIFQTSKNIARRYTLLAVGIITRYSYCKNSTNFTVSSILHCEARMIRTIQQIYKIIKKKNHRKHSIRVNKVFIYILISCSVFSKISSITNHVLEMQHTSLDCRVKLKERDFPLKSSHRYQVAEK